MSTLIVAAIIIGAVVIISFLLNYVHNKHKREAMNKLLTYFSEAGTKDGLRFSSQELLKNTVMGVDGVSRKLLIANRQNEVLASFVIDLQEMKSCAVQKIYASVNSGDGKNQKPEQYLEKIVLQF